MKLLIDCHCFDSSISQGITTYIKGIYQELPLIANDIDFYFVCSDIDKIRALFGDATNIYYIPLKSKSRLKRLLFEIPKLIKQYNIDVAHFQYVSPIIKNCKTIVTLHDILFVDYPQYFPLSYRIVKGLTFKLSAKRADLLCTVSQYSREQIHRHYRIDNNKIIITPNGVSDDFYSIEGEKPIYFPKKYILFVSRIEPRKNHIAVIKAFQRMSLADKGYHLVFIGKETIDTPELHNLLATLQDDIKSKISIISDASFHDIKLWYKYASLFIYPTLAEGFGIPPIEAGAAGVPVICNNSTAMRDFTFFNENLIDISNSNILERNINRILSGHIPDLNMISSQIHKQYNWKIIARNFNKELNLIRNHIS